MTIPVPTGPVVKAALVALVASVVDEDFTTGDPQVGVWYTDAGANFPDDNIMVGKISQTMKPMRMVGGGGALWMNESYAVEVDISAHRGGDNAQKAEERVFALAGLVGNAVRSDPSLGGLVLVSWPASLDVESEWIDDPGGFQATGSLRIEITDNPL